MLSRWDGAAALSMAIGLVLGGCIGGGPVQTEGDILYVALGASDAAGIGAVPPTEGYVYRIEEALEREGRSVQLLNLGVPGGEVGTIADSLDALLATGADPDLVTLWTGANDIIAGADVEGFRETLEDILAALRNETDAFVVIGNIPNLTQLPRYRENPDRDVTPERIAAFNEAIRDLAAAYEVPVADLTSPPITDEMVSDVDGFHPNNQGHLVVAQQFLNVIRPNVAG